MNIGKFGVLSNRQYKVRPPVSLSQASSIQEAVHKEEIVRMTSSALWEQPAQIQANFPNIHSELTLTFGRFQRTESREES